MADHSHESARARQTPYPPVQRYGRLLSVVGDSNLVGMALTCLWLALIMTAVWTFRPIFLDFRLALSWYSRVFTNLGVIAGMGGLFMAWFICGKSIRTVQLSRAMGNLGIVGLFIAGAAILAAVFLPLIEEIGPLT